jgi:GTP-binding protein HflX
MDRQHIRRRITRLRREITDLGRTRRVERSRRERSGMPAVALAGYTNAGKSTLLNALTGADALVADQPFATLDPTTRRLTLPTGREVTVSDTVGFVRKLPHELVAAFRSTLEEVARADVVVHVADASADDLPEQVRAVRDVLGEIGAGDVPEILVLNKWDRVDEVGRRQLLRRYADGVPTSALDGEGIDAVGERIAATLPPLTEMTLLIPHDRADVLALLHREGEVEEAAAEEAGTRVRVRLPERVVGAVAGFSVAPARIRQARA